MWASATLHCSFVIISVDTVLWNVITIAVACVVLIKSVCVTGTMLLNCHFWCYSTAHSTISYLLYCENNTRPCGSCSGVIRAIDCIIYQKCLCGWHTYIDMCMSAVDMIVCCLATILASWKLQCVIFLSPIELVLWVLCEPLEQIFSL